MYYEPINGIYNVINIQAHRINADKTRMQRNPKKKNQMLYKLQMKFMELHSEIIAICSGKKGQLRSLVAGRYNFSGRAVISQKPSLRIDQVILPYTMLVIMLQPQIINILNRLYNMSYSEAYNVVYRAIATKDERVATILDTIIKNSTPEGLPVIINRNPTIAYG
jgi:DNA-directed RNA polymerase beta' subunit